MFIMVIIRINITHLVIIFGLITFLFQPTNMQSFLQSSGILDISINTSEHLPIRCTCNLPITETRNVYKSPYIKCTVKDRWDKADLLVYFNIMGSLLYEMTVPVHLFSCPIDCKCTGHRDSISQYYSSIGTSLRRASLLTVPRIPCKLLKQFSFDDFDWLKEASLDAMVSMRQASFCIINSARLKAKYDYMCATKKSANDFESANADEISYHLLHKDNNKF